MNEGLGNSKGNFTRIAMMCGLENDIALHKFIDVVRRRIDAAYELGKVDGIKELKRNAIKDAHNLTAAIYMRILTKKESK
jgi:hypothetical protein